MSRAARTTVRSLQIAYNSCRNRHCPKCQGAAGAGEWLAAARGRPAAGAVLPRGVHAAGRRSRDHRLPEQGRRLRHPVHGLRRDDATIAADPKHLGARIGITAVLHTWGSALTHHPHVHMIVPGGGISLDGTRWIACRPDFFLPVQVLSRLFRRLFLEKLVAAHGAGRLAVLRRPRPPRRHTPPSRPIWRRCARASGWSMPSGRSADRGPCWPTCRATPTASPSPTAGSSPPTTAA